MVAPAEFDTLKVLDFLFGGILVQNTGDRFGGLFELLTLDLLHKYC
ncbi:MAG: hypothetical protein J7642_02640 [Cyanobacteria bacterium SBC]|nr:hypothetical protein [Cyanobacteria bacterium SBC]